MLNLPPMRDHIASLLLALALGLTAAGCGSSEQPSTANPQGTPPPAANAGTPAGKVAPVTVGNLRLVGVEIGRSVNPDNTMYDATRVFIPSDKVWVSVTVEGTAPHATLQARFVTDAGQVVEQASQEITPNGQTTAAFHSERAGGWTTGPYRVEILLNGVSVGSQPFEVREPPL